MEHRGSRVGEWYAAGLFLVYAAMLFALPKPPSLTDYANWTYQGVLLRDHLLGRPDALHALKPYPVPNSAATLGIGVLALALPWTLAAKVWLCAQWALSFAALRHLARTIQAGALMWFILPQAVFFNVNLWYGFVNFQLGLCWVLLMASLLLRRIRSVTSSRGDGILGLILLLAFFTHMIPFAFCGLLLILYARQTRRFRVLWQLAPGAAATVWYLAGRYLIADDADGQAGMVTAVRTYSAAFWAYKANSYLKSFGFINPGFPNGSVAISVVGRLAFAVLFTVNLTLCGVLAWRLVQQARIGLQAGREEQFLWLGIALMLPIYLLAPGTALGVSDPGSRVLQVALTLALVLCATGSGAILRVAASATSVLALSGILFFAALNLGPKRLVSAGAPLPRAVALFAHVPYNDQDYFYGALTQGDRSLPVFPTGMFLNQR